MDRSSSATCGIVTTNGTSHCRDSAFQTPPSGHLVTVEKSSRLTGDVPVTAVGTVTDGSDVSHRLRSAFHIEPDGHGGCEVGLWTTAEVTAAVVGLVEVLASSAAQE